MFMTPVASITVFHDTTGQFYVMHSKIASSRVFCNRFTFWLVVVFSYNKKFEKLYTYSDAESARVKTDVSLSWKKESDKLLSYSHWIYFTIAI